MTKLDRILAKPHKVLLWSFTGLIVAATAFTLFESNSTTKRINDKKKRVQRDKSVEEIERDSKNVSNWSKKELFDYLTRVSIKWLIKNYTDYGYSIKCIQTLRLRVKSW